MLPSRRDIKRIVEPYALRPSPVVPTLRLLADALGWMLALALVAADTDMALKALGTILIGLFSARLFVIGHDACHGSYTRSPRWNKVLGRLAFLPTLTAYSVWEIGHNVAHHGYNNLRTHDDVWAPITRAEYEALPPLRRFLYRRYRSGWWPGLYYMLEIWWTKLFFPSRKHMTSRRPSFFWDNVAALAFGLAWIGVLLASALLTEQSIGLLLLLGFALPYFVWCSIMGFVVYVQHTHPSVRWYDDKSRWAADRTFLTGTVHVSFPGRLGAVLHNILDHTAHHVDMSVPFTQLTAAQAHLTESLPHAVVVQPFGWRAYFDTARTCALYDYEHQRWEGIERPAPAAAATAPR